jgi:ketosteroid isomerase-like protein
MIVTIGGIPVYEAVISTEDTGMFRISLVDDPAVMSNFQAFDNAKKPMMYSIQDEEKRLVRGVVMRADFPIYRYDEGLGEYYVIYKADQIRKMAEKYLLEGRQNNVNLMHQDGSDVDGVNLVQYFIKGAGVSVEGFDDIADGSLLAEFHITNDDVWAEIKAGTYKGFSLEGVFDLVPEQDKDEIQEIVDLLEGAFKRIFKPNTFMSKLSKFKAALAKMLQEFGNVTTDKGVIAWDGDEDLKAGDAVFVEDADGNRTPAPEGDYRTTDNKVIVVVDGKVSEIKDAEAEVSSEFIETDKGKLEWDNEEEDLKAGDSVYVRDEEGNRVPAPDGDYTTEDGKVIKVADGKVTEIVDSKAEVSEEEVKAKRISKFSKIKEAFEESFDTKMREISNAIAAVINTENYYLVDAGEDFGVVETWNEETYESHYFRYAITWNEDGTANAADPVEVKLMFVPMDMESPFAKGNEEEMAALRAENDALKEEVAKMKKMSAAKPAHQEVQTTVSFQKTGIKGLDQLQKILSAK